jgi:UDP:flavonoid glycosyltransferase YjiC (YdhE family)
MTGYWFLGSPGWTQPAISPNNLSANHLAAEIHDTIENNELRRRVAQMGQSIRDEDGVGRAVALVERYLESGSM